MFSEVTELGSSRAGNGTPEIRLPTPSLSDSQRHLCLLALKFLPTLACLGFSEVQTMVSIEVMMITGIMYAYMLLLCIKVSKQFFPFSNTLKFNRFHVESIWWGTCRNIIVERQLFLGFGFLCWGERIAGFSISGTLGGVSVGLAKKLSNSLRKQWTVCRVVFFFFFFSFSFFFFPLSSANVYYGKMAKWGNSSKHFLNSHLPLNWQFKNWVRKAKNCSKYCWNLAWTLEPGFHLQFVVQYLLLSSAAISLAQ